MEVCELHAVSANAGALSTKKATPAMRRLSLLGETLSSRPIAHLSVTGVDHLGRQPTSLVSDHLLIGSI